MFRRRLRSVGGFFSNLRSWALITLGILSSSIIQVISVMYPDRLTASGLHYKSWQFIAFSLSNGLLVVAAIFKAFQERKETTQHLGKSAFIKEYTKLLFRGGNVLHSVVKKRYDRDSLREVLRELLEGVCSVVISHLGRGEVNASIFIGVSIADMEGDQIKEVSFFKKYMPDEYSEVLVTLIWANDNHCSPDDFSLPVHTKRNYVLFGAPKAFKYSKLQIVADIHNEAELRGLLQNQDDVTKQNIIEYCKERETFRSFADWPLQFEGTTIGVLNVQSSQVCTFGEAGSPREELCRFIEPFCPIIVLVLRQYLLSIGEEETNE